MKYPNRIQAALLLDTRFEQLDAIVRDFTRIVEMKSGATFTTPEHKPGVYARLLGGGDDLTLTFEYVDTAPQPEPFATALASPITGHLSLDMSQRVAAARSHILLEVSHGVLAGLDENPDIASMMRELGAIQPPISQSATQSASQSAFHRRLDTLSLMVRIATDHITPSAIHWTQSNQLFEPDTFETMSQLGFPGPITIHPALFGAQGEDAAPDHIGVCTFGARHWLDREILVLPSALPWSAAYEGILAFCTVATMEGGYIIPDGDTFGPEDGGEVWRVRHHDTPPAGAPPIDEPPSDEPIALYELIPLRHDECAFLAPDYARQASVLRTRDPGPSAPTAPEAQEPSEPTEPTEPGEEPSSLAELEAALAEGRAQAAAQAAAHPPEPMSAPIATGTPSQPGGPTVSGRDLRARVFGNRND